MAARGLRVTIEGQSVEINDSGTDGVIFGRDAVLDIDSNPFLHRHTGRFIDASGIWWVENLSTGSSMRVSSGGFAALLPAGARLALTHERSRIEFTAGPCHYELIVDQDGPIPPLSQPSDTDVGLVTRDPIEIELTDEQRLLVVILAEDRLRSLGRSGVMPRHEEAAERLGWNVTKFNRKLDYLCQRVHRACIEGMRPTGRRANARRTRLVDYLIDTGQITADDLVLLDAHVEKLQEHA